MVGRRAPAAHARPGRLSDLHPLDGAGSGWRNRTIARDQPRGHLAAAGLRRLCRLAHFVDRRARVRTHRTADDALAGPSRRAPPRRRTARGGRDSLWAGDADPEPRRAAADSNGTLAAHPGSMAGVRLVGPVHPPHGRAWALAVP